MASEDRGASTVKLSKKEKTAQDELAKEEVRSKIVSGEYVVVKNDNSSPAWLKFGRVARASKEGPPVPLPFVQCFTKTCGLIKMYNGGTGGMADHQCRAPVEKGVGTPPTIEALQSFENALISLFSRELLPLSLAGSSELIALIAAAVKIGSECGNINAKELIPHPKTLTLHIKNKADAVRSALVKELKDDLQDGMCSATVDGWVDSQRGRKYLAHTVSNIDENFELRDNLLFIPHRKAQSVTATVIKEEIKGNLANLSLNPDAKLHYVSDDGADIVCALKDEDRTYCMDHCTNLVVKKALTPRLTKLDLCGKEGGCIVDNVQQAVNLVKKSRLKKLTTLKGRLAPGSKSRFGQVRFQSSVPMLKSAAKWYAQLRRAMMDLRSDLLDNISLSDVQDVIKVMAPIELLAMRSGNSFNASHHRNVVRITERLDLDSPLTTSLKTHISQDLCVLRILELIAKTKRVVTYFKKSGLNEQVTEGSLKQECETRWMSLLYLLQSFFPTKAQIKKGAQIHDKLNQINDILLVRDKPDLSLSKEDIQIMSSVKDILEGFEEAIKRFEAEKIPTIQHVLPQYHQLKKIVANRDGENVEIAAFRVQLQRELPKFERNISSRHLIGAFLWPKFATLTFLSEEQRAEVHKSVRDLCAGQKDIINRRLSSAENISKPPPGKKHRSNSSSSESDEEYADLCEGSAAQLPLDEVDQYLLFADPTVKSKNILQWWKDKSSTLPALSRVARLILGTPASSTASERQFSVAGRLISSRRNCLSPETVEDLLLIHDFVKKRGFLPN